MLAKSLVSFCDEVAVKSFLAAARLVSRNQKDGSPFRVEREGQAPDTVSRVKPQLLHIRVEGAIERIGARSAESRTELRQQQRMGSNSVLYFVRQRVKLGFKILVKLDFPVHY